MIKIKNKDMKELITAWEGHVSNNTECEGCSDKRVKCPIHLFFKKAKKDLKITVLTGNPGGKK